MQETLNSLYQVEKKNYEFLLRDIFHSSTWASVSLQLSRKAVLVDAGSLVQLSAEIIIKSVKQITYILFCLS